MTPPVPKSNHQSPTPTQTLFSPLGHAHSLIGRLNACVRHASMVLVQGDRDARKFSQHSTDESIQRLVAATLLSLSSLSPNLGCAACPIEYTGGCDIIYPSSTSNQKVVNHSLVSICAPCGPKTTGRHTYLKLSYSWPDTQLQTRHQFETPTLPGTDFSKS